jgi:hypothetical protein
LRLQPIRPQTIYFGQSPIVKKLDFFNNLIFWGIWQAALEDI